MNHFTQNLTKLLNTFNKPNIILGLSGGLDSIVLLDLVCKYTQDHPEKNITLIAVYINHQLQTRSDNWAEFNADVCKKYNLSYESYKVNVDKTSKLGLEGEARLQRYNIFKKLLINSESVLITAHHQNDQAETVLLQLMRAAGPKGLSAMPAIKKLSQGWHIRPLLDTARADLLAYAQASNLSWIEDTTNQDNNYDRNFLRNIIIPELEQRWPLATESLANSAKHCANHENLLNNYIKADYLDCLSENKSQRCIDITKFKLLDNLKQQVVLRYWFSECGLLAPGPKKLTEIIKTVINAGPNAKPKYMVENKIITRHKKHLYVLDSSEVGELS